MLIDANIQTEKNTRRTSNEFLGRGKDYDLQKKKLAYQYGACHRTPIRFLSQRAKDYVNIGLEESLS